VLTTESGCDRPGLLGVEAALKIAPGVVAAVPGREMVSLRACAGRITATNVASAMPLPPFDQSAVDGYGIHVDDVAAAFTGPFRLAGKVVAGSRLAPGLAAREVERLFTGAAIPKDVAAVVMEEKATVQQGSVWIRRPAEAGLNIRRSGEDVAGSAEIIEAGTLIDARHVAILAASGASHVAVRRRVRVVVLSTGDELIRPGGARRPHQIYDGNGPMLQALFLSSALQPSTADAWVLTRRSQANDQASRASKQPAPSTC
jgi:molybdopterin molybdotransferase